VLLLHAACAVDSGRDFKRMHVFGWSLHRAVQVSYSTGEQRARPPTPVVQRVWSVCLSVGRSVSQYKSVLGAVHVGPFDIIAYTMGTMPMLLYVRNSTYDADVIGSR
jgi:hypothetical protein